MAQVESYHNFIASKHRRHESCGIDIDESEVNPNAFDFQRAIVKWNAAKGRCGTFADCGLGKSLMELDWLRLMIRKGGSKRALLLTPVAVGPQMLREAEKFNIDCDIRIVKDSSEVASGINVTNYEKLHKLDPSAFDTVCLDEASILKSFAGKTKRALCDAFSSTKYRMVATATPAPNDHMELGNQCEFLGVMQREVMLSQFFVHDGGETSKWRLRGHAKSNFWNWVSSWALAIGKPSDIGFGDEGYQLPELNIFEHVVESDVAPAGFLFNAGSEVSATNIYKEKGRSAEEKAELISGLVNNSSESWVCWVDTNTEADALRKVIPDAVEVRGSDSEESKCDKLEAFTMGKERVLITKPKIGGFGLNWQHCHNTTYMANFSFEMWYQAIRRFYRFGQAHHVNCHIVMSDNETNLADTLSRKQSDFTEMMSGMTEAMRDGMFSQLYGRKPVADYRATSQITIPSWLTGESCAVH